MMGPRGPMGLPGPMGPPGKGCNGKFDIPVELNYKSEICKSLFDKFEVIFPHLSLISVRHIKSSYSIISKIFNDYYIFEICTGNDLIQKIYSQEEIETKYNSLRRNIYNIDISLSNMTIITE